MAEHTMLNCQSCRRPTKRLYGGDHCSACHLGMLVFERQGAAVLLEEIEDLVRSAVKEYAHPDDIRERVELVLREPEIVEWTPTRERLYEIDEQTRAHEAIVLSQVAFAEEEAGPGFVPHTQYCDRDEAPGHENAGGDA